MKITILGGGESGTGAALLAKQKGVDVFVSDGYKIAPIYKALLVAYDIPFEEEGHTQRVIQYTQEVIKSPGIPSTVDIVKQINQANIPIIDEVEFAARYAKGIIIAITGSNGKSTTAHLTYHLLKEAQKQVALVGNIGHSFAKCLTENSYDYYVLELSSFQLEGIKAFKPHIACLLNITPDHLDRYDGAIDGYARAKLNILRNMTTADHFIYNKEDPITQQYLNHQVTDAQLYPMARLALKDAVIFSSPEAYHFHLPGIYFTIDPTVLTLPGVHNQYNAMVAIAAVSLAGVTPESITHALPTFCGLPHRIEWCGAPQGVDCYNDSKATNVASTMVALNSFTQPIVWIVGGEDKGNDYTKLLPIVKDKVKAIVCLGKDNKKIIQAFGLLSIPIQDTHELSLAVDSALSFALPNEVILFSPACASFDLFKHYQDRGDQFREKIKEKVSAM
ncbi:MAG: UDP-N-acetylmuramoyl-L-alanine--D-glutamate ligase [Amoebophilaceae bacterium]|nr:UDP-N-acetylmuramoyl-L-alanine--D-glutamate ligase [Amoebophilaceae bacterium]